MDCEGVCLPPQEEVIDTDAARGLFSAEHLKIVAGTEELLEELLTRVEHDPAAAKNLSLLHI